MAEQTPIDIRRLASLLDDPDESVAVSAMAELLNREYELGDLPAELQESSNPLMRRRAHQLQSALTMIQRRRYLAELLRSDDVNIYLKDTTPVDTLEVSGTMHYIMRNNQEITAAWTANGLECSLSACGSYVDLKKILMSIYKEVT